MKKLSLLLISACILVLMTSSVQCDLVILSPSRPDNSSYPTAQSPPGLWAVTDFNITAELVLVNGSGCDGYDGYDIEGKMVAITEKNGCSYGRRVVRASEGNALAVIFLSGKSIPGQDARMPPEDEIGPFELPAVYIGGESTFIRGLLLNSTVIVNLTPSPNQWVIFYDSPGFIAYQAIFLAIFAGTLGIAIWKLVEVVRHSKCQFSILQVFIWVEIVNNAMRMVYFFDPFRSRGVYNIIASFLLETLHMPLTFIASMLVSLYWLESVSDYLSSKPTAKWLGKMSAPFYIFLALVSGLYVAFLTIAYLGNDNADNVVTVIFVLFGCAAIVLIGVGAKVLSVSIKLSKSVGKTTGRNLTIRIMTVKLVFVALGMILLLSIYPSYPKIKSLTYIERLFGQNVIIFGSLAIVSIAQLLTIQKRRPSKSWTSNSGSTKLGTRSTSRTDLTQVAEPNAVV